MPKESEIRFLGDLQRLTLKPGDRFVLIVPGRISPEMAARIQDIWTRWTENGDNLTTRVGKLLILEEGMKLGLINAGPSED
jgi:hypothetical protein